MENQPLFPLGCFVIAFHDGKADEESLEKICDVWETGNSVMDVLRIYPSANDSSPLTISVVPPSLSFSITFFPVATISFVTLSLYFATMIYVFPAH